MPQEDLLERLRWFQAAWPALFRWDGGKRQ
jgi:hypothetical protein